MLKFIMFILLLFFYSSRPVRFGLALPCTLENKENARPYVIREDSDDSSDGQVLYRDDYDDDESKFFLDGFLSQDRLAAITKLSFGKEILVCRIPEQMRPQNFPGIYL